jgi:paraquat-inducible protein B
MIMDRLLSIATELQALTTIALYGQSRLKVLPRHMQIIKEKLDICLESKEVFIEISHELDKYHALVQASFNAIIQWIQQLDEYRLLLDDMEIYANKKQHMTCQSLRKTMANLMQMFSTQIQLLQQEQNKTEQLSKIVKQKRKSSTTFYERGKAPLLVKE